MKSFCWLVGFAVGMQLQAAAQGQFTLNGQVDDSYNGQYINFYGIDWSDMNRKFNDSVLVTKGQFTFTGNLVTPGLLFSVYTRHKTRSFVQVYLQNGNMKLVLQGKEWHKPGNAILTGSQVNDQWISKKGLINIAEAKYYFTRRQIDSIERADPSQDLAAMKDSALILKQKMIGLEQDWMHQHPDAYISLVTLAYSIFHDLDTKTLNTEFARLSRTLQKSAEGGALRFRIDRQMAIQPGNKAPELAARDTSGNAVHLKDFKGQYVLLDFWASWCGPCIAQVPALKQFHQANKDKKLTIIGVSLDDDGAKWKAAIAKHQLNWMHVSDLKGWKGETGKTYNIAAIPQNVLIGPDGRIVAVDIDFLHHKF